jgi:sugar diacid utilization regulator
MSSQRIGAALDAPIVQPDETSADGSIYREAIGAFGDVAAAIGELRDQDDLLHLIARKICELVGVPRCSVYLRDAETGLYRGQVGHSTHDIDASVKRLICGTKADGFTNEIIATRAPVVIRNVRTDRRPVRSVMRAWNVVSMMGVPMVIAGTVVGLIFLDTEEDVHDFDHLEQALASAFADLAAIAISQSRLYNELRSSHETVARQNGVLRRAAAVDDKLTSLVLNGCNLREIAEAVAELTRKPCAIHDADGRQVAAAVPVGLDGGTPPRLLDPAVAAKPEILDALSAVSGDGGVVGPFPGAGLPLRFLATPVSVRDTRWGMLVLSEQGSRFGGFDMLIARRSATVVALELSAARRAANAEWNARSSLASELIRGNHDAVTLEARAEYLGTSLRRPHVLCLITGANDGELNFPEARQAAAAFREIAPKLGVLATEVAEGIALIVEIPERDPLSAGVREVKELAAEACANLAGGGLLRASISTACRRPDEYSRAYHQACEVARCIEAFGVDVALSADDLGAARLFLANTDPAGVEQFAQETLGTLLEENVPPELLHTLSCFFEQDRSVRQSAAALDVHENTIRYRLGRIEELTGLAVASDSGAQLSAQLAVLILRLQNAFPAEPA